MPTATHRVMPVTRMTTMMASRMHWMLQRWIRTSVKMRMPTAVTIAASASTASALRRTTIRPMTEMTWMGTGPATWVTPTTTTTAWTMPRTWIPWIPNPARTRMRIPVMTAPWVWTDWGRWRMATRARMAPTPTATACAMPATRMMTATVTPISVTTARCSSMTRPTPMATSRAMPAMPTMTTMAWPTAWTRRPWIRPCAATAIAIPVKTAPSAWMDSAAASIASP